jgi:hypothetical protein
VVAVNKSVSLRAVGPWCLPFSAPPRVFRFLSNLDTASAPQIHSTTCGDLPVLYVLALPIELLLSATLFPCTGLSGVHMIGRSTNSLWSVVNGISFSTSIQPRCPWPSYARRCNCHTPSCTQRSIRGASPCRKRLRKTRNLRSVISMMLTRRENAIMKAKAKTLTFLVGC